MNKHVSTCQHCHDRLCTRKVPIFSSLDDEENEMVANLIVRKEYARGERIITEGTDFQSLIIINHGKVKAFRNTWEGKEQILYIFTAGDFFGEKNLLGNQAATYNVETLEETNICSIMKEDFQKLLKGQPKIGLKIMEELSNRLERLENTIETMGSKNVEARVSWVLMEFAQKYGKPHGKGIMVELPLSREGIANYIGLTRETVSRKMGILQEEGIIEMVGNKKVIILDKEALEASM